MDNNTFCTKNYASHTKNRIQGFIISNLLLMQTPVKLRKVFVHIFEIHIIGKIYPKHMDSVTSTGRGKISLANAFVFPKLKVLL